MNAKKKSIHESSLYWVAGPRDTELPFLEVLEASVRAGLDVFQLRDKTLSEDEIFPLAKQVAQMLSSTECLFIINDWPQLAVKVGADGAHVGQHDCSIDEARAILGKNRLLGLSTHSFEQATNDDVKKVDYIGYGPIFKTPTKVDYTPVGLNTIQKVLNSVSVPVFCIGGIDLDNIDSLLSQSVTRIAVVREIALSMNPHQDTKMIKNKLWRKNETK